MHNPTICLLATLIFCASSFAQAPHYDDLTMFYADGKYPTVVKKGEKYTSKSNGPSTAVAYLYMSMANFEMSKDAKFPPMKPTYFNQAIKFAGKCVSKDKEGEVVSENKDFFVTLKTACVENIQNHIEMEEYNRLRPAIMKLHRFDKEDIGSWFLMTTVLYMQKDKPGAKESLKTAMEKLDALESTDDWRAVDYEMYKIGITEYEAYLRENSRDALADELMEKAGKWME